MAAIETVLAVVMALLSLAATTPLFGGNDDSVIRVPYVVRYVHHHHKVPVYYHSDTRDVFLNDTTLTDPRSPIPAGRRPTSAEITRVLQVLLALVQQEQPNAVEQLPLRQQLPPRQFPTRQIPARQFPDGRFPARQFINSPFDGQYPTRQFPTRQFPNRQVQDGQFSANFMPESGAGQFENLV